ncbi:MAG: DUF554 domain-containing protein [Chloroflexi bacterium]|nr:DUF554 domain-containing protein [Chloroflexota bacterium]
MRGTILNTLTVLLGSSLGLLIGNRLPERMQQSVITGLGVTTLVVGMGNANQTGNIIIPLLALLSGVIIGELLRIDMRLEAFGGWLQARVQGKPTSDSGGDSVAESGEEQDRRARFVEGFVTASLVFCVGPLTFIGSIQDGMGLDEGFETLAIKSTLDAFASMAFAATLGVGVMFSVITILSVQGGLALLGSLAGEFMTDAMIDEMTAVGGLMLLVLSLVLLDIKEVRAANFLPGLLIAPLIVAAGTWLGIDLYPV